MSLQRLVETVSETSAPSVVPRQSKSVSEQLELSLISVTVLSKEAKMLLCPLKSQLQHLVTASGPLVSWVIECGPARLKTKQQTSW